MLRMIPFAAFLPAGLLKRHGSRPNLPRREPGKPAYLVEILNVFQEPLSCPAARECFCRVFVIRARVKEGLADNRLPDGLVFFHDPEIGSRVGLSSPRRSIMSETRHGNTNRRTNGRLRIYTKSPVTRTYRDRELFSAINMVCDRRKTPSPSCQQHNARPRLQPP